MPQTTDFLIRQIIFAPSALSSYHLDVTTKRSFSLFPRKNLHSTKLASIYKNLHTPATPNHSARRALNRKLGHPSASFAPSKSLISPSKCHVFMFLLAISRCNIFYQRVPVVPLNFTTTRIAASALLLSSLYSISQPPPRFSHHSNPRLNHVSTSSRFSAIERSNEILRLNLLPSSNNPHVINRGSVSPLQ